MHPMILAKHLDKEKFDFAICVIENSRSPIRAEIEKSGCVIHDLNLSRRFYNVPMRFAWFMVFTGRSKGSGLKSFKPRHFTQICWAASRPKLRACHSSFPRRIPSLISRLTKSGGTSTHPCICSTTFSIVQLIGLWRSWSSLES